MFMSAEELEQLTGYARMADQRKWLTRHGWKFEVSATGKPIVSRQHAEMKLAGAASANSEWKPNIAAIRKAA